VSAPLKLKRQRSSEVRSQSKKFLVAELKPVASVLVDTPVSHLEGIYDYLVPQELSSAAVVGTKVLIEFGKAKTEGLILARKDLDASIPRASFKTIIGIVLAKWANSTLDIKAYRTCAK